MNEVDAWAVTDLKLVPASLPLVTFAPARERMDQEQTVQKKKEEEEAEEVEKQDDDLFCWCVFCKEEIKDLSALEEHYKQHKDRNDIKCSVVFV